MNRVLTIPGDHRSRADLEAGQLAALRRVVAEVSGSNAFYRSRWGAAGFRPEFGSLEEFRDRFPFVRKHDLGVDQASHPPYGTNLTYPIERYIRCHGTSGSTGNPLRWLDTAESWEWMLGNWRRVYAAAGVGSADRLFFAFSFGPFLGFWTAFESALSLGCLCLPGGGLTSVARLRSILEQQATVLCCTPTYAVHLGDVARAEGIDLAAGRVRRVIVAGEPGGSLEGTRQAITERWPGAKVSDHHGMTEVGPVSYECPVRPGVLHVIEDSYLAEIVDPCSGRPVGPGVEGELVLTTLGRTGSPLLRYRTGDLVRARTEAGRCECGAWDLALPGGILGRTDDMAVIRGVNVFPSAVEEVVRSVPGIAEYRAEVHSAGALLDLKILAELSMETGDAEAEAVVAVAKRLEEAFRTRLALRVTVEMVAAGTLPRFEMKARRWVRTA